MKNTAQYSLTQLTNATGWAAWSFTNMVFCQDYKNLKLELFKAWANSTMTVKVYQSDSDARPNLWAAASATNKYTTVQVVDSKTGTAVNGDTGIAITADGIDIYSVNVDWAKWIGLVCTAFTKWTVDTTVTMYNDQ